MPAEVPERRRESSAALAGVTESLQEAVQESEAIFAHVPPGPATVQILADGAEVCAKRVHVPKTGELRVDCPARTAQVRGTVRIGGELAGPGTLVWRRPGADDTPEGIVQTRGLLGLSRSDPLFSSARPVTVAVDERGRFGPLALPPGRWEVRFHKGAPPHAQVEVPEGRECVLAIDMPGIALTGWAVDADERPVGGAVVSAEPTGASTVSGADGRFALIALPPGHVSVEARQGDRRSQKLTVELTEDRLPEPVRLRLVPPDGHELAITVRTARGDGAAGAVVVELDATIRFATADAAGQARVSVAAPFPSEVRAFAFTGAALGISDRMPWEVARRRGVSLTLPEPAGIEIDSASRGPRLFFQGSDVTTLLRLLESCNLCQKGSCSSFGHYRRDTGQWRRRGARGSCPCTQGAGSRFVSLSVRAAAHRAATTWTGRSHPSRLLEQLADLGGGVGNQGGGLDAVAPQGELDQALLGVFLPTTTRTGKPTRSASLNLTPARSSRSSNSTSTPADCSSP